MCANVVCCRDDGAEELRSDALQRFREILAQGGDMDVASHSWIALGL